MTSPYAKLRITSVGRPDVEAAADAALPLFLKFLEARRARLEAATVQGEDTNAASYQAGEPAAGD